MDITVSVRELLQRVSEMDADGMDFVTLSVAEADEDDEVSAFLMFEAWSEDEDFAGIDYDSIDAITPSN